MGAAPAFAQLLSGDLDGDGVVDTSDEVLLRLLYGTETGEPGYAAEGDLDGDGRIDHVDLALFGAAFGTSGGAVDGDPPGLLVTLNDIPDDMNDLLVVPPDGFAITLLLDTTGGSMIDPSSLSVTSSEDIGPHPAGSELAPLFTILESRASLEVPEGSELARTSHYLDVSVRDAAGNESSDLYGFAVRDFPIGRGPLEDLQTLFLDFDRDRSLLAGEVDFLEDLREYGLSSTVEPGLEAQMRDRIVSEIVARVNVLYGIQSNGALVEGSANILFTAAAPLWPHSVLCVGGRSAQGASYLGSSSLDLHNMDETSDECGATAINGVFPNGMQFLWGTSAELHAAFDPLDPGTGGTPVGEHVLDATVLAPGFDPGAASAPAQARFADIENAVDAFSQAVAGLVAHENGHLLGLTAPGAAPAGLYGGETGAKTSHNVTPFGGNPTENYVMNQGGATTFAEMTGRAGNPLPSFRPLNWAYLRNQIALNIQVTELLPPPTLTDVQPNPLSFSGQGQNVTATFTGTNFVDTPLLEFILEGDPTPNEPTGITVVDPQTVTAQLNKFVFLPGVYDVRFINPDGQVAVLDDGLTIE